MADITLGGNPTATRGNLPEVGSEAPDFLLVKTDMSRVSLADYKGKTIVFNIFPSIDTGVCANSVRTFNEKAARFNDTVILCVSRDLPFAHSRFCEAEGISNVIPLSDFNDGSFGHAYGATITDGDFEGLLARAIVIVDTDGKVKYTELVNEIGNNPDFDSAIAAI